MAERVVTSPCEKDEVMAFFRMYSLDGDGEIIEPSRDYRCETDEEAFAVANGIVACTAIEIWQGNRLVGRAPVRQ
jgi:hypothetical protein